MDENSKPNKRYKMNLTRLTNLLYEASSSLVPGTGELYSTKYANDNKDENEKDKTK